MQTGIDRSSPLPFYHQLKEILTADITRRNLSPGDRLPGDHELCERYDVSRTVVRQALSDLEAAGVIDRVKGRGTFVARPKTREGLAQSLTGLYEDVATRGSHLRSDVRRLEKIEADDAIAESLQVPVGTAVIALERLRFVDDEPWVLTVTHVPFGLAPGLLDEDLSDKSLYAVLENTYGVRLSHGRRSIDAEIATSTMAHDLGVKAGAALLVLRSVSYGDDNTPVEAFVAYHRGDRSRFEVELTRSGSGAQPLMLVT
ncbi:GntR family transcriptional regulator [Rhodococcus sp. 27YEA15]|uniref:GntR family transcriptional regulator n=1 Tax=Rhodococcus sp. 27YEA15 TaxID=3156259 RepID=UPI003C79E7DB